MLPSLEAKAKERQFASLKKGQAPVRANLPEPKDAGRARDEAAKLAGVSPRTISDAKYVTYLRSGESAFALIRSIRLPTAIVPTQ